jgi:hypothetical protein
MAQLRGVRGEDQTAACFPATCNSGDRPGREQLGLAAIVAVTSTGNLAPQQVLRTAGLVYERDFLHEGVMSPLFRAGTL